MDTDKTIQFVSKYLKILGVVQLLGLNLAGFLWFFWASGIRQKKRSSRGWVFFVHGLYLIAAAIALLYFITMPGAALEFTFYNNPIDVPDYALVLILLAISLVYITPIALLLKPDVAKCFRENGI